MKQFFNDKTGRIEFSYDPLVMDEDISGPWDHDPDYFKKNPQVFKELFGDDVKLK